MDGTDVAGRYGEIWSTTNAASTNHFDQALNDLWVLEHFPEPLTRSGRCRQVTPSNSSACRAAGGRRWFTIRFIERQLVPRNGFCPFGHPIGAIIGESDLCSWTTGNWSFSVAAMA
jgi:hypothetical protein